MGVAKDFVLLATDPDSGRFQIGSMAADAVLGGALLVDLVAAGKVQLRGEKRAARVVLVDKSAVGDAVVDRAIRTLQLKGPMRARVALRALGTNSREPLYRALAADGQVRSETGKKWGLFPYTRWPVVDGTRRNELIRRLNQSLTMGQPVDAETGPLVGLMAASDRLRLAVDRHGLTEAKARAKVIAEGDWASAEVRKAIQIANAVMMTAVIAAISAGAGGS